MINFQVCRIRRTYQTDRGEIYRVIRIAGQSTEYLGAEQYRQNLFLAQLDRFGCAFQTVQRDLDVLRASNISATSTPTELETYWPWRVVFQIAKQKI